MELKVIGTGSSGNAYLLENKEEALLIECGVRFSDIKAAINFNFNKLVGCIVSHEHGDHAKSMKELMAAGVDVYSKPGTFKALGLDLIHRANPITGIFHIGGFKIMSFDIKHDAADPCGFLINHKETGNILFLTDAIYSDYKFKNLHNIIIEANYDPEIARKKLGGSDFLRNRIINNHMSIDTCIDLLKANDLSQVNNIVLIHLSDSNSNEIDFEKRVKAATNKNVTVADNGVVIEFNKTPF